MFDENADRDPIRLLETAAAELEAFGQPAAAAAVRETVRRITESLRLTPPSPGDAQAVPEVLTPQEAADLLRISRKSLERLNLPYAKIGSQRRYLRQQILEWLEAKAR